MTTNPEPAGDSHPQRYQIIKKIDAGGMAEIYLGKSVTIEGMEKTVAIKRVLPNLVRDKQFITMFLDEARLSMLLTHANIVQVFDVGRSGETYFIVMEYINGWNLRRVFQKASEVGFRMPLEVACFIMMEALKGLAHAHEKRDESGQHLRIVHRDLSPPNIMVSKNGEVKVMDFGLAKAMTQLTVTDPGVVKGKFSYLAPEAADGRSDLDHRVDIFACGIVLWELLSNRRLFLGRTDVETVELVRKCDVPPLSSLNPQVTQEFQHIVDRLLAKDPRRRFTSSREAGEAIANYLFSRGLKVTGYDLAEMVQRMFAGDGSSVEAPEERIATLIQEEILNLSMLGDLARADGFDGSQSLEPGSFAQPQGARLDLSPYFERLPLEQMAEGAGDGDDELAEVFGGAGKDNSADDGGWFKRLWKK